MSSPKSTAAESLLGVLAGDWTVMEKLSPHPGATGGYFSVGYLVQNNEGRRGFLKAIDFARAFDDDDYTPDGPDLIRILQNLTATYNFEREILQKCRELRLSRVATAISDGSVMVSGFEPLHRVFYLIFELAAGDARLHLDRAADIEIVWCLTTLQQVATGLKQLHWNDIAHQDVKPSNVLEYAATGARIGDLGRASDRHRAAPHDDVEIAGDKGYAPPELLYGFQPADWNMRRFGCDAYLLGSLTYFFFTRASMTAALISKLHPEHTHLRWRGSFDEIVPYLRQAFDDVIQEFETVTSDLVGPRIASDLVTIVRELCEPDPALRGDPSARRSTATQFSMEKYITRFNVLARRAAVYGRT